MSGKPVSKPNWTYTAIEHIFDYVKGSNGLEATSYSIYGHSAGAQFVHRLLLFCPDAHINKAICANAGWYTMPSDDFEFPYGLKGSGISVETLKKTFSKNLIILLGNQDTDENHKYLRKTPKAMAQGKHRFERGKSFFLTAKREAAKLKTRLRWKAKVIKNVGHSNSKMAEAAAKLLTQSASTTGVSAGVPLDYRINAIRKTYGVNVHFEYDPHTFFPEQWLRQPVSAKGAPILPKELATVLPIIEDFLSKYPKYILQKNLSDIYLLGELEFYGKSYGATNSKSALYIKSQGESKGFDKSFLLGIMHSEFSSILLRNYKNRFPEKDWQATNVPGWKYLGNGTKMLRQHELYGQSEQLLSRGFLVKYALSSLENDFNMFTEWIFTKPNRLRKLASEFHRINEKYQLTIKFYNSIDPSILKLTGRNQ